MWSCWTRGLLKRDTFCWVNITNHFRDLRDHSFKTYVKWSFSKKINISCPFAHTHTHTHTHVRNRSKEILVFRKMLRTYKMDNPTAGAFYNNSTLHTLLNRNSLKTFCYLRLWIFEEMHSQVLVERKVDHSINSLSL